jgi:hypothetical protein
MHLVKNGVIMAMFQTIFKSCVTRNKIMCMRVINLQKQALTTLCFQNFMSTTQTSNEWNHRNFDIKIPQREQLCNCSFGIEVASAEIPQGRSTTIIFSTTTVFKIQEFNKDNSVKVALPGR